MSVETLCSLAFIFFPLLLNFFFRDMARCGRASLFLYLSKPSTGSEGVPSESVASFAMPTSVAIAEWEGCTGRSTSLSVCRDTNQCLPERDTVTFFGMPSMVRLFLERIHPSFGREVRLLSSSIVNPRGYRKESPLPFFLNRGKSARF